MSANTNIYREPRNVNRDISICRIIDYATFVQSAYTLRPYKFHWISDLKLSSTRRVFDKQANTFLSFPLFARLAFLLMQIRRRLRGVPTIPTADIVRGSEESRGEVFPPGCGLLEAGERRSFADTAKPGHACEQQL